MNSLNESAFFTVGSSLKIREGSYSQIKKVLEETYVSAKHLEAKKAKFLKILVKKDEKFQEFGRRFLVKAQTDISNSFLTL